MRFTETVSTGIVTDNVTGKEYNCEMRIDDKLLELLNELHEENKQLKQEMGDLGATHAEEINKIEDEFDEEILKLEKENEQLKTQLQELKEDVPLLLAFYRWYPFAVEKKEHQAYNRLWDFVND